MSLPDSAQYWDDIKKRSPYMGEIFFHIGEMCSHYKPETGNILTSKYLNDINCYACKKLIKENGNIYGLIDGVSKREQKAIDKEKHKFRFGKCPKCENPLRKRMNKIQNVEFLGCSNYPKCNHTQNL